MTRKSILLPALAAALGAAAAAGVSLAAASPQASPVKTMHFAVRFVNDSELDLGDRGPSVGDQRTFYDVLYDASGKKAGYDGGVCAVESMNPPVFSCGLVFSLRGGQISTQFLTTPGPAPKPLAITGGTGAFRGVRGEATLVEFGRLRGSVTFRLA